MNMVRRTAVTALLSLLTTVLVVIGLFVSVWVVLSNPDNLKSVMSESGIYRELPRDALNREHATKATSSVPISRPEVQAVVERSFPAAQLETDTNRVIDGFYAWLQGKTAEPEFTVDITASRQSLASGIAQYAQQRLASLPRCSMPVVGEIDVFTTECLPGGFDIATASQQVKRDVLSAGGPLEEPVLTAATLKDDQGRTLTQQFAALPRLYQNIQAALFGLVALTMFLAVGIILLYKTKLEGVHRVGMTAIGVGAVSALAAWLGIAFLKAGISRIAADAPQNTLLQEKIGLIVQLLADQVRSVWLVFAVGVAVVGGLMVFGVRARRRSRGEQLPPASK